MQITRRLFLAAALALGSGVGLGGCGESSEAPTAGDAASGGGAAPTASTGDIPVGVYASLTGAEATFGQMSRDGILMAFDEINAAGGVNGRKIRPIVYDDEGKSQVVGTVVTRLITDDKVVAVLGEVASSLSLAGGAVCQQYNIPMITPASTNPRVTQAGSMVFRVCFIDPFQGFAVATFARENLKFDKVAILYDQGQAYSTGLADDFEKAFKAAGGTITTKQAYTGGDQDFNAQLTTIRETAPQGIFVPGYYTDVGNIALQTRKLGMTVPLLGGDGWTSSELHKIGGEAIEGSYFSNHYSEEEDRPLVKQFVTKFNERYKVMPDSMAALGYDAALVLADAIKRAGSTDSAALAKAIGETSGLEAVTGKITLDAQRNAQKPAVILQVAPGGAFKYVASVAPKAQ